MYIPPLCLLTLPNPLCAKPRGWWDTQSRQIQTILCVPYSIYTYTRVQYIFHTQFLILKSIRIIYILASKPKPFVSQWAELVPTCTIQFSTGRALDMRERDNLYIVILCISRILLQMCILTGLTNLQSSTEGVLSYKARDDVNNRLIPHIWTLK